METVKELFYSMEKHAKNPAIQTRDGIVTYGELIKKSTSLAEGLKQFINPGDKIAVFLPNSIDWIIVELAAGLIGATVVTLNLRYKLHELTYILQNSETKMFIFQPDLEGYNYAALIEELFNQKNENFPHLEYIVSNGETSLAVRIQTKMLNELFQPDSGWLEVFEKEASNPMNILNIMYTSGTTSNPKGAMIPQRVAIKHSHNVAKYLHITSDDVVLGALPFCGILGFNTLFAGITSGASIVPMERYRPIDALHLIEEFRCTLFVGVDGMMTPLFDMEDLHINLSSMKIGVFPIFSSNNRTFIEKTEKIFPCMKVVQPYGMTEVSSMIFVGDQDASLEVRSLAGGPSISPEIEVEIADKDSGVLLNYGEEGEIVVRGYNVMAGYYKNPEKTKESFTPDGWFKTGDLGVKLEDGTIIYKSRLRDALRLKGFLVSPKEIEDYICLIPEIEIVQVVHVTLETIERLVAFIKLKKDMNLSEEQIKRYCKAGLADFKCPQTILFVDEFPTTAGSNGEKIQKNKLQEMAKEILLEMYSAK